MFNLASVCYSGGSSLDSHFDKSYNFKFLKNYGRLALRSGIYAPITVPNRHLMVWIKVVRFTSLHRLEKSLYT